jgi:hypothetical protein
MLQSKGFFALIIGALLTRSAKALALAQQKTSTLDGLEELWWRKNWSSWPLLKQATWNQERAQLDSRGKKHWCGNMRGNSSDESDSWRKNKAVQHFTRAVIQQFNGTIGNLAMLDNMATFLNGSISKTTYGDLLDKLVGVAAKNGSWLSFPRQKSDNAVRSTDLLVEHISLLNKTGVFSERDASLTFPGSIGRLAPQSDQGYYSVMSLKSDAEMNSFISRAIKQNNFSVTNSSGLAGMVPWFSGVCAVQTYSSLVERLRAAARRGLWLTNRSTAPNTSASVNQDSKRLKKTENIARPKASAQINSLGPKANDTKEKRRKMAPQSMHPLSEGKRLSLRPKANDTKEEGKKMAPKSMDLMPKGKRLSFGPKANDTKEERKKMAPKSMHLMPKGKRLSFSPKANDTNGTKKMAPQSMHFMPKGKKLSFGPKANVTKEERKKMPPQSMHLMPKGKKLSFGPKANGMKEERKKIAPQSMHLMPKGKKLSFGPKAKASKKRGNSARVSRTESKSEVLEAGKTETRAGETEASAMSSSEPTKKDASEEIASDEAGETETPTISSSEEIAPDEDKEMEDADLESADVDSNGNNAIDSATNDSETLETQDEQLDAFPGLAEDSFELGSSSNDSSDSKEEKNDDETLLAEEEETVVRELKEKELEDIPEDDQEKSEDEGNQSDESAEGSENEKLSDDDDGKTSDIDDAIEEMEEGKDVDGSINRADSSSETKKMTKRHKEKPKGPHKSATIPIETELEENERDIDASKPDLSAEEPTALSDGKADENDKSSASRVARACVLGGLVSLQLLRVQ